MGEAPPARRHSGGFAPGSEREAREATPAPQLPAPLRVQNPPQSHLFLTIANRLVVQFPRLHARLPTTVFSNNGPPNKDCTMPSRPWIPRFVPLCFVSSFFSVSTWPPLLLCQVTIDSLLSLLLHCTQQASKSRPKLSKSILFVLFFSSPSRCVCSVCLRRSLPSRCLPSTVLQNAFLWSPINNKTTSWADSTLSSRGRATRSCPSTGAVRRRQRRGPPLRSCKQSRRHRQQRLRSPSLLQPKKIPRRPSPRQTSQ